MLTKRQRCDDEASEQQNRPKRLRLTSKSPSTSAGPDLLSPLSDELLLRVLSFLPVQHLLFSVGPVSRRFHRLAGDSQLWKALYYARFVLPRAMRIPGFRDGYSGQRPGQGQRKGHKLHYSGRRTLWADGRQGGVVRDNVEVENRQIGPKWYGHGDDENEGFKRVNWKRQYKIRHNWSRGKCAVEELRIGHGGIEQDQKVLVKVVEGVAITADASSGLRAWDLKTKELLARVGLDEEQERGKENLPATPSSISIDESHASDKLVVLSVGFLDGGFGLWELHLKEKRFQRRYRHPQSKNGELIDIALSYPYLLTATRSILVSLYTFDIPADKPQTEDAMVDGGVSGQEPLKPDTDDSSDNFAEKRQRQHSDLPAPYLLTSLKSHTSRPPLALSIRSTARGTIASIAYTFSVRNGWAIGMQDLHIRPDSKYKFGSVPEVTATRLAYTTTVDTGVSSISSRVRPVTPTHPRPGLDDSLLPAHDSSEGSSPGLSPSARPSATTSGAEPGPTTLCYTHPYLLAALPDNTLVLHLVTSTAENLTLSPSIRLWGHTSGISDAEITSRGKAVSVSGRGHEMRVWELEGGSGLPAGSSELYTGTVGAGRSVEIRPDGTALQVEDEGYDWDERRNWVGFDDEMVIVLKESKDGSESLMVYDFT